MAELAVILPVFALLLIGALDLGRVFSTHARLTNATREGALHGAYAPSDPATGTTAVIRDRAYAEANGRLGQPGVDFIIDPAIDPATGVRCYDQATGALKGCNAVVRGDLIEVTGRAAFRPLTTQLVGMLGTTIWVRKTVRMAILSG